PPSHHQHARAHRSRRPKTAPIHLDQRDRGTPPRSRGWWQRALEVAEHPSLSPEARAVGLRTAREHYPIRYPDQLRPAPTEAERAAALGWIDRHADD
ncbi:hypothetical protein, partial [Streptomyces sp. NPDC001933]|uniref:hypothetical protein n=1 Tax=Streptomyces sp. NPDC001933 TaxID=3364626 RepID=UPI00368BCEAB